MLSNDEHIRHALRRNGVGARILVALLHNGKCSVGRLSEITGARRERVRGAIRGKLPDCRHEHALRPLGLIALEKVGRSTVARLTVPGYHWARRVEDGLASGDAVGRAFRRGGA